MDYYYVCDRCTKIRTEDEMNALIGSKASRWICNTCMKEVIKEAKDARKRAKKERSDKKI